MATGLLKQYLDIHKEYSEKYGERTVALMLVGSFYEMYAVYNETIQVGPDLKLFADILNVTLTRKDKKDKKKEGICYSNPQLLGFPEISLGKYQDILLKNGYTIVMVEQITPPPNPERAVTTVLSPSTVMDIYDTRDSNHLMSVFISSCRGAENTTAYMAGVSTIDVGTGRNWVHFVTSSVKDETIWKDEIYRLIHNYSPSEAIIHSDTLHTEQLSELCHGWGLPEQRVKIGFFTDKEYMKKSIQERYYQKVYPSHGQMSAIEYIGLEKHPEVLLSHLYMIEFVYQHMATNVRDIDIPCFKETEGTLVLSNNCLYQLYLIDTKEHTQEKYSSILSLLNRCQTAVGRRLCKERLLYPILDSATLDHRYECVDQYRKTDRYVEIRSHLRNVNDIERMFRKMGVGLITPQQFANMHDSLVSILNTHEWVIEHIPQNECYHNQKYNETLAKTKEMIESYTKVYDLSVLGVSLPNDIDQAIFKKGYCKPLDDLFETMNHSTEMLHKIASVLGKLIDKKAETIKVVYQDKQGYLLKMTQKRGTTLKKSLSNLPNDYTFRFKVANKTLLIHKADINVSGHNKESKVCFHEIDTLSSTIMSTRYQITSHNNSEFIAYNKQLHATYHNVFQQMVDYLGELDLYSTQAYLSIKYGYCRPKVDETTSESYLDAKSIRHPLVERVQDDEPYVPNDVTLRENGMLLFGTNACGKSTLMKSIGIAIVMAQAGFFVACREFTYSPYTQLFTRILNNDNLFQKQSSFAVEMNELRSILNRSNRKSLVLGDELCSGTENVSAISIVSAGLHTLSTKRCSYIFTSHLHQLTNVDLVKNNDRLRICHLKIEYDVNQDLLIYDRTLSDGSGPPVYGLEVCKAMHLDSEFLAEARKVQLSLMGESYTHLNFKKSNYNTSVVMDKCEVCKKRPAVETHHIKEQQTSDIHKMQGHHHQNIAHNLVPLCKECHAKVTYNQYCIQGYKQTNHGLQLMHHENLSENKDKSSRKKYSPQQVKVVETYKDKLDVGWTQKKCILDLKHNHEIHISDTTFRKIITGNY